jgi:hypothetical protein
MMIILCLFNSDEIISNALGLKWIMNVSGVNAVTVVGFTPLYLEFVISAILIRMTCTDTSIYKSLTKWYHT